MKIVQTLPPAAIVRGARRLRGPAARALGACCVLLLGFVSSARGQSGDLHLDLRDFLKDGKVAPGRSSWAPRQDLSPKCSVDTVTFRSAPNSLSISGNGNPSEYGGWAYTASGIKPGTYYRLSAHYRTRSVPDERRQVVARLDWHNPAGGRVGQPDYAYQTAAEGDWNVVSALVPAPQGAVSVRIELALAWAPQGTVWWDDLTLEESAPPPARVVRVGTISLHPHNETDNLSSYLLAIDRIARDKPDIVCLGEEILVEGNSRSYASVAEPVPGPSTSRLGERARRYAMYLVAGLTEREGHTVYNTAVLIDRHGNVAGKYRKVYLPREEVEGGITPGNAWPVFDTDFGRIGMMICWDNEYVDGARAMALKGAEILFVPAAGGYMTLLKARALENHLYVVSSGYDVESSIIDPTGQVLFSTLESGVDKTMAINLSDRFWDPWLGDMRPRFHKEVRTDIAVPGLAR